MSDNFDNKGMMLENAYQTFKNAVSEVEKVIVGKHNETVLLLAAIFAGGHVLIEDVPGVGKTTLASAISRAIGLSFNRIQFTPDVLAADITGFNIYNRKTESFEMRDGLVMCNLLLADEINRASPKTQSALLEAMEERRVTVDGVTYDIPDPFTVVATQNPTGYVGTYPLPEAQLDRFMIKLTMGYPSQSEEIAIIKNRKGENPIGLISPVADTDAIRLIRRVVSDVKTDPKILKYIVTLVSATRTHKSVKLGASPRASVAMLKLSQAFAFTRGRNYVVPDDVAAVFKYVVAHRLVLNQDARLNKITADDVLTEIRRSVEVPYINERELKETSML